jgi:hypothetical protein
MNKELDFDVWKNIVLQYEEVGHLSFGLAPVRKQGKWGYIDETGKEVVPCKYDEVKDSDGTPFLECKKGNKWLQIDDSSLYERTHKNNKG